jgi:hypothetical protein
MVLKERKK